MRKTGEKLYRVALGGIQWISILFVTLLTVTGVLVTCHAASIENQTVVVKWDNWLLQLLLALAVTLCLQQAALFIGRLKRGERLLLLLVLLWVLFCCLGLILWGRSAPSGDSFSIYDIAANFAMGNYEAVRSRESYLAFYPQQIGLIAFYEAVFRLCNGVGFPVAVYHFIKVVNSIFTCLIVLFQWKTVKELCPSGKGGILYLLLIPFCFPLFMYSSFLYGEIPSLLMMSMAMWFAVRLCRRPSVPAGIGLAVTSALSVAFRKNSLIFIIAVAIVLLVTLCRQGGKTLLAALAATAVLSLAILPGISGWYEHKAGAQLGRGVPVIAYVAMGMQESGNGPGAYNGFNYNTYLECGGDQAQIKQVSQTKIAERWQYFKENPDKLLPFYWNKFMYQWTNGEYGSRQATAVDYGGRSQFLQDVYNGKWYDAFTGFAGFYQFLIYAGALGYFLALWRKRRAGERKGCEIVLYTGFIAVFGGFLFHMVWEAGSRYIFPYFILLIPCAAMGLERIMAISRKKKGGRADDRSESHESHYAS